MRSILLMYRILLPPVFLFRLCLPRPPELQEGQPAADSLLDSDTHSPYTTMHKYVSLAKANSGSGMPLRHALDLDTPSKHSSGIHDKQTRLNSNAYKQSFHHRRRIAARNRPGHFFNVFLEGRKRNMAHPSSDDRVRREASTADLISTKFKIRASNRKPPDYMVHLFQLLSGTHYEIFRNIVVTSFVNVLEEVMASKNTSARPRAQMLAFDVFLPESSEIIQHAELRLHVRNSHVENETENKKEAFLNTGGTLIHRINVFEIAADNQHRLIASKNVSHIQETWLSLNITSAVLGWPTSGLIFLEVRIDTESAILEDDKDKNSNTSATDEESGKFVFYIETGPNSDPLLILFSKKNGKKDTGLRTREKRDVTRKENKLSNPDQNNGDSGDDFNYSDDSFEGFVNAISNTNIESFNDLDTRQMRQHLDILTHTKRSQDMEDVDDENDGTQDKPVKVTFPNSETLKQSSLKDSLPLRSSEVNNIGQKAGLSLPSSQSLNQQTQTESTAASSSELEEEFLRLKVRRDTKARYRRHLDSLFKQPVIRRTKRSKKRRNSCRREELYVDFASINYNNYIVFPNGYQAFQCTGKCYTPISDYLTPTKHAIIQTLLHTSYPEKASRACCVPTQLDPISIIYFREQGGMALDYTYEDMVVTECGCR